MPIDARMPDGIPKAALLLLRGAFLLLAAVPVVQQPSASGIVPPLVGAWILAGLGSELALLSVAPPRLLAGPTLAMLAIVDGGWAWGLLAHAFAPHAAAGLIVPALAYGLGLGVLGARGRAGVDGGGDHAHTTDLERRYQASVAANRTKREFVANMSHELRTPLNIIIGYTDMLQDPESRPDTGEQARLMTRIHKAATNLLHLVDMVLDLEKLDAGKIPVLRVAVPMDGFVGELERRERIPPAPGTRLAYDIEPDLPVIETDAAKLVMILDNLIGNAIKFTTSGTITIRVRNRPEAREIEFQVEDTGPGIDARHLTMIFQPFQQVERSCDNPFGGVGLGLAIVHRFVQLLGGTIAVRSALGVGTCFTVVLPHRPSAAATENADLAIADARSASNAAPVGP